jgi:hypothetical protein
MKKVILPVTTFFMAYALNAQWSTSGGKAATALPVEIELNNSGQGLRIEGINKDLDL